MAAGQPYGIAPTGPSYIRRIGGGGHAISCVYSPRLTKDLGCTMLPLPIATDLEIETRDGVGSARVMAMPFIDPRKQLAKES